MSREITSHPGTKKFSFIYALTTISISHDIDEDLEARETISVKDKKSTPETEIEDLSGELESSSALVKQSQTSDLLMSAPATITTQWYELDLNPAVSELDLYSYSIASEKGVYSASTPTRSNRYLDKIFFTVACGYLVLVLWWLLGYKNGKLADVFAFIPNNRQETISQSNAEFLDYMERSLEIIDRKLLTQQEEIKTASKKDSAANIVYVPVYTPNPTTKAQEATPIPIPFPPPPPPSTIATVTTPVAKITSSHSPKPKLENPGTIPTSSEAVPAPSDVKPSKSYTLVGLMEWGEKPTAMFKAQGGTKRVVLGENIDDSGWKLEAIKERNVVISRQGKSRTINIGEKF